MIRATFDPTANGVNVYRWDNLPNGQREYWTHEGKRKILNVNDPAPWWMVLSNADCKALVSALADHLDDMERGDPEDYGYIKGLYEAQRDHLLFATEIINKLVLLEPPLKEPE